MDHDSNAGGEAALFCFAARFAIPNCFRRGSYNYSGKHISPVVLVSSFRTAQFLNQAMKRATLPERTTAD